MHVTKHNELHTFSNIIFKLKKSIVIALYRNLFYINWKIVFVCNETVKCSILVVAADLDIT